MLSVLKALSCSLASQSEHVGKIVQAYAVLGRFVEIICMRVSY